jgi:hypothetical protein
MNKQTVRFEMGVIDPRNLCFDHHGTIEHSNAFIGKMAAVQFLEYVIMTDQNPDAFEFELNHCGHLDDFVLHAAGLAKAEGKLRSLYQFAAITSVLDSCGPSGYKCITSYYTKLVNLVYEHYHEILGGIAKDRGVSKWELPLEYQIDASCSAARMLVDELGVDSVDEKEIEKPDADSYKIVKHESGITLVEGLNGIFNPLQYSGYFYSTGTKVLVSYTKLENENILYTACLRCNYDGDLSGLWEKLSNIDPICSEKNSWGGHAGAGGSPRGVKEDNVPSGSQLDPEQVYSIVQSLVNDAVPF